ncbi:RNA polymerase sigma factor [Mucilaginibacter sp. L196]|uniref:RNA polymerase sigma factor n=1 Tax=Mucilaginibacter sp. L196 TaxID=1641870 RepID=UPI00131A7050|nr:RNA polymerase sigma-70 factor [Mucilaginibacter sp. L196]
MLIYSSYTDSELVDLLKSEGYAAFTEIYERYFGLLYVHAKKKVRDQEEARDMVQEIFISLWNRREFMEPEKGISSYLYTALRNKIIDWFAHQDVNSRYVNSFQVFANTGNCVTDYLVRENQFAALIEKEVHSLPPRMREIFELSRKVHLSHREIAEQLNISELTVKTQIKYALRTLRVRLGILIYFYFLMKMK